MKKIIFSALFSLLVLMMRAQNCPTSFTIQGPFEVTAGDTLIFIAEVKGVSASLTYNWSISTGTILSGQGTAVIQILTDGLAGMYLTATVELGGLSPSCVSNASSTVDIMAGPEKIISANYTTPQLLTAAVQKFIAQTKLDDLSISQTAFIYVYAGATTTDAQLKTIKSTIISVFEKNKVLSFQYKIAD